MDTNIAAETSVPGRGTPESAAWFRDKLAELGLGHSNLARRMLAAGDDRQLHTILRMIQRMAVGHARVSGEMRTLLTLMGQMQSLEATFAQQQHEPPHSPA